jgi:hypothetical protein
MYLPGTLKLFLETGPRCPKVGGIGCRVSERKAGDWELSNLNQCLTLSLSRMERNEPLLISASYFWSNAMNAFILVTVQ